MRFLAGHVSKDCFVNIMEQYHPDAYVGKKKRVKRQDGQSSDEARYEDINRAVSDGEVSIVRKAAEAAGLWRFNEPPKHDGFAI